MRKMSPTLKKHAESAYSVLIGLLAVASIVLVILDLAGKVSLASQPFRAIDTGILLVFVADYAVRFWLAEDRKQFFKRNIPDLLAIIPFNSMFSMFRVFRMFRLLKVSRILRITRLLRAGAFLTVLRRRADGILHTNGLIYVIYVNLAMILCASLIMMQAESMTFADALWWSIVTCTTVGYGDISPSSPIGRIVAVVLMIFGIGLLGMVTGAIATYFSSIRSKDDTPVPELPEELRKAVSGASVEEMQKIIEIARIITRK